MKLLLVRHGQTNYNELGLNNSDPSVDVHLTETGIQQVEALAEKLRGTPIGQIYISELPRTRQTADMINKFHNAPIEVDPRLNDIRTGYENKSAIDYFAALDAAPDRWNQRFDDGESVEDIKIRVASFIADLKMKPYETVLVVTSRDLINAAYGLITNISNQEAWNHHVDKGSCLELEM